MLLMVVYKLIAKITIAIIKYNYNYYKWLLFASVGLDDPLGWYHYIILYHNAVYNMLSPLNLRSTAGPTGVCRYILLRKDGCGSS